LDIEHPAGKILVDLAQQQDKEVKFTTHIFWTYSYDIHLNRSEMVLLQLFSLPLSFSGEVMS
jgi:hypothetical protein